MSNLAHVVDHACTMAPRDAAAHGIDALLLAAHVPVLHRRLRAGEAIHRAGERLDALHLIQAGTAKTLLVSADGREKVTGFAMRGDLLGADSLGRETHAGDAVALEDGVAWQIPVPALLAACEREPALARQLAATLARDIRDEREWTLATATLGARQRVARWLVDLGERQQARGFSATRFVLRATRAEIGSFLGLTLETVTRALTALADAGLIAVDRRDVQLRDVDALRALGGDGAVRLH